MNGKDHKWKSGDFDPSTGVVGVAGRSKWSQWAIVCGDRRSWSVWRGRTVGSQPVGAMLVVVPPGTAELVAGPGANGVKDRQGGGFLSSVAVATGVVEASWPSTCWKTHEGTPAPKTKIGA